MSHDPTPPCQSRLDRERPFATVYGEAWYRFEQDGKKFDHQGVEILTNDVGEDAAKQQPRKYDAAVSEKSRSAAAERMRRTRERRRVGIIVVVGVEITKRDVEQFVARNLRSRGDAHDREKIAIAVRRAMANRLRSDLQTRTRHARAVMLLLDIHVANNSPPPPRSPPDRQEKLNQDAG